MIAAPLRFDMKTAQTQKPRLGAFRQALEGFDRRGAIAGELRGLGAKKMRQRLIVEMAARFRGGFTRQPRIAGADGDHAARERCETLGAAAHRRALAHEPRRAQKKANDAPEDGDRDGADEKEREADADRGLDMIALPGEHDVARPVGDPGDAEGDESETAKKDQNAKHRLPWLHHALAMRNAGETELRQRRYRAWVKT